MIRRDRREMPLKQGAESRTRTRPVCGKEHRPERVFFHPERDGIRKMRPVFRLQNEETFVLEHTMVR